VRPLHGERLAGVGHQGRHPPDTVRDGASLRRRCATGRTRPGCRPRPRRRRPAWSGESRRVSAPGANRNPHGPPPTRAPRSAPERRRPWRFRGSRPTWRPWWLERAKGSRRGRVVKA
jgi:hypothetical protein